MLYSAVGPLGREHDVYYVHLSVAAVAPQVFRRQSQGLPTSVVGSKRPEPIGRTALHPSSFPYESSYESSLVVVWQLTLRAFGTVLALKVWS